VLWYLTVQLVCVHAGRGTVACRAQQSSALLACQVCAWSWVHPTSASSSGWPTCIHCVFEKSTAAVLAAGSSCSLWVCCWLFVWVILQLVCAACTCVCALAAGWGSCAELVALLRSPIAPYNRALRCATRTASNLWWTRCSVACRKHSEVGNSLV
jgi:hypothetical protein